MEQDSGKSGSGEQPKRRRRSRGGQRVNRERGRQQDESKRSPSRSTKRDPAPAKRSKSTAPQYEERTGRTSLGRPTAPRKVEKNEPVAASQKPTLRATRAGRKPVRRWRWGRALAIVALAALLAAVLWRTMNTSRDRTTITYSEFVSEYLAAAPSETRVTTIHVIGERIEAVLREADEQGRTQRRVVYLGPLEITPDLVDEWIDRGIAVDFRPDGNAWRIILTTLPYVAIIIVIVFLFRQAQGAQRGIFSFGKSRAKELSEDVPGMTFDDVAGVEEAKQELQEIVEFLKDPERFQRLGGTIPRGVLMVGAPGTGKTYLARAIAGEARAPFFSISGSDFVEMFVGVGASRVRDLFERAKAKAPCIVFVDEIDAVGRHRGAGLGGGHDEREQTLNQLLVEMDGFNSAATVILIAATNRPDVLDPALLRPGRFDRRVVIDMPDVRGREGILKIHTRNMPLDGSVDHGELARGTPGLSGADLKNLVNEAALLAARRDQSEVQMADFESAREKVMWGVERRSLVMSENDRRVTAVHEAGHALAALLTADSDPVHKVSIVPRGQSLGLTAYLPDVERHVVSRTLCEGKLVAILGGRAAESLVLDDITNGAASDLEAATELARRMVCDWGMSDRIGAVMIGRKDEEVFIGRDIATSRAPSEQTLQLVDEEIHRLIGEARRNADALLKKNRAALDALTSALLQQEVLERSQIEEIILRHSDEPTFGAPQVQDAIPDGPPRVVERPAQRSDRPRRERERPESKPRRAARDRERPADTKPETPAARPRREAATRPEQTAPTSVESKPPTVIERPAKERTAPAEKATPVPVETQPEARAEIAAEETAPSVATEPTTEEAGAVTETPVAAAPSEPEVEPPKGFGRTPKRVRRSALPSSEVPDAGADVSTVKAEKVDFGRAPRAADDEKEQQWRLTHQSWRKQPEADEAVPADADEQGAAEPTAPEVASMVDEGSVESPVADAEHSNGDQHQATPDEPDAEGDAELDAGSEQDSSDLASADEASEAAAEPMPDTDTQPEEEPPEPAPRFGRRANVVRRSALPSSQAPATGMEVATVVGDEIGYGRSTRSTDDDVAPEPAEPTESTEQVESAEQPESIEQIEPVEQPEPEETTEDVESTEQIEPAESAEESESTDHAGTTDEVTSSEQQALAEPTESTEQSESNEQAEAVDQLDADEGVENAEEVESTEQQATVDEEESAEQPEPEEQQELGLDRLDDVAGSDSDAPAEDADDEGETQT